MVKLSSIKLPQDNTDFSIRYENGTLYITAKNGFNDTIEVNRSEMKSANIQLEISENSKVEFIEIFDTKFDLPEMSFNCECHGYLKHCRLFMSQCPKAKIVDKVIVDHNGEYLQAYIDLNQGDVFVNTDIFLNDVGVKGSIYCATVCNNSYHKNYLCKVVNNAPLTKGYIEDYGVAFQEGNLHITGIGDIKRGARGASSRQKSTMFVLDALSKAVAQPYLYIDEDDVEASHASAVGQVNDETIFYLCSRGIEKEVAKRMVVLGYFKPIVEQISDEITKQKVFDYIQGVINND